MTKEKTPDKKSLKKPPSKAVKSIQYDLFRQFTTNDESSVSNTVELWDSIPKYFFTPKQVEKLRTADGLAKSYTHRYMLDDVACEVKIQPALVEVDGEEKAYFPGKTEGLVEEVMKKILTDQNYGLHDPDKMETWIRFSLSMIWRELKSRGRERNRQEIKHAIEVMSKTIVTFYREGVSVWSGTILQDLTTVGRGDYLADSESQHIARLPLFISHAINHLEYRQFNYQRLMSCNDELARWIYKRLINRFKQASFMNDYHFMYSDLKGSGLLQQAAETDNRKKVLRALDELVSRSVLMRYTTKDTKLGNKIVNVKYTLYPDVEFIKEQKASNKRNTDNKTIASRQGISIVDKSKPR